MRMVLAVLVNSFLIVSAATPLLAKANTVKITIKGSNFKTPIEISDPKILANFQVWTGPGTISNEKQGFIIDWSQGQVVLRGHGVMFRGYQVSFHTSPNDQVAYVVYYSFSPGEEQGYVYVPGESDEWYGLNVRTVFRGVEGKLFRAWDAWERVARPLIEKAEHLEADPLTRERIIAALTHGRRSPEQLNPTYRAFIAEGRASVRRFDADIIRESGIAAAKNASSFFAYWQCCPPLHSRPYDILAAEDRNRERRSNSGPRCFGSESRFSSQGPSSRR